MIDLDELWEKISAVEKDLGSLKDTLRGQDLDQAMQWELRDLRGRMIAEKRKVATMEPVVKAAMAYCNDPESRILERRFLQAVSDYVAENRRFE